MTIGCFPVPVDGELLYGLLARHRLLSGARTAADHSTELFGGRSTVASFDLPYRLDALADRLPVETGLDGAALLSLTHFPFYAAFQTQETREVVEYGMRAGETSSAHLRLGVAAFRVRGSSALRFCQSCLDAQVRELGVGTWLLAHQLPGVVVCPLHGVWLRDSLVTRATAGRRGYVAASEATCRHPAPKEEARAGERAMRLLQELSQAASALATSLLPARTIGHWHHHYIERLTQVGLMRSPRKVDQATLNEGLKTYWGPALPYLPMACSCSGESGWTAAMVRTHHKAKHPLFHLLLDGFIRHLERAGAVQLVTGIVSANRDDIRPIRKEKALTFPPFNSVTRRIDWAEFDLRLTAVIVRAVAEIRAAVPPLRVSRAEIERRVAKVDWFGNRRTKLPCAMRVLRESAESVDSFRRRRAEHWIDELGPAGQAWAVMRAAGLRSAQLPMIREAMVQRAAKTSEASHVPAMNALPLSTWIPMRTRKTRQTFEGINAAQGRL